MPRRRIGTQIYSLVYHNLPPFSSINIKSHKNVLFCRRKGLAKDGRRRARTVPETTESGRYSLPPLRPQETAFCRSPPFSLRPQKTAFCRSPPFPPPTAGNRLSPLPAPEKIRPRRPPKPPKTEIFIAYIPPPKIGIFTVSTAPHSSQPHAPPPSADRSQSSRKPKYSHPAERGISSLTKPRIPNRQ